MMKTALLLSVLMAIWPFSSGQTFVLAPSSSVPAASGTVKVSQGDNGNTKLEVKVKHLALPSRLTPPAAAYLVWIQPRGQAAHKLGAIQLDDSLNGDLTAVTTVQTGDLLITAEQSVNVEAPTSAPVLQGHIELKS
jgi:hypothetical protein